jgi:hypothetical protein
MPVNDDRTAPVGGRVRCSARAASGHLEIPMIEQRGTPLPASRSAPAAWKLDDRAWLQFDADR